MANFFSHNLSIRSRLMLMLIIVSAMASLVLIAIGYFNGKTAITKGIFNQLTSVRAAKQYQIESYFNEMAQIVEILGTNETVAQALKDFKQGFSKIESEDLAKDCNSKLTDHYEWFIDRLLQNMEVKPNVELYYPTSLQACYLQYEYIVENPNPPGDKHLLLDADDGSAYNLAHKKYHNYLTDVILKFGFYDIFLIDLEKGDIVYTSYKETDFATNLYNGPYRESNLANLTRQLRVNRDLNKAQIIDFSTYRPSYGAPAAFIGMTITEGSETIGAIVLQLPVDEINRIMTGNFHWEQDGLGASGETYLVGEDHLMRSISRFYIQDTIGYTAALGELGIEKEEVERMYRLGTTIKQQRVKTEGVIDALAGNQDTRIIKDYRHLPVLSSYAKLKLDGLNWAILSEIDEAEANIPIIDFEKKVFIALCIIILIVTFLAMLLAGRFVKPIEKLTEGVRRLSEGDYTSRIDINSKDEFGELAYSFNNMIGNIETQQKTITQQSRDNEKLLLNFIPESIARRLLKGETDLADTNPNVSLIAIDVVGFSQLTRKIGAGESVSLLNQLVEAFDHAAEKNHVEKIRTVGDTYFAACGLFAPRLDHAKRIFEFARELKLLIIQFNINHKLDLHLNFGLHTGEVTAGIVGKEKYSYDLWGMTVNGTFNIKNIGLDNEILVSDTIYDKLKDIYRFQPFSAANNRKIDFPVWQFSGEQVAQGS